MATILIRFWLTEQSFKNRLEAQESRAGAVRSLLKKTIHKVNQHLLVIERGLRDRVM